VVTLWVTPTSGVGVFEGSGGPALEVWGTDVPEWGQVQGRSLCKGLSTGDQL